MQHDPEHILIVDDNHGSLMILSGTLYAHGYVIATAGDGASALKSIDRNIPDLILLDIMMPDMNGFEVCRRIRQNPEWAEIPIIFITALTETEHKINGFGVGGVDYITKPLRPQEVLARVSTHLKLARTQRELRNSRRQLQAVFNNAAVCIGLLDANGHYRRVNGKCVEFFGYQKEDEIIGMRCLELNHPAYRPPTEQALQALRSGELDTFNMDKQFIRKDGSLIWGGHWMNPLRNADGVCEGFVCVIADLTRRKQAEETIRKLSRAVEQSHNTIVITDTAGNIEFANPAFSRTTGYSIAEALGQNPRILKSGAQDSEVYQALWDTLAHGDTWRGELCNKRKDGSLYWEQACISPIKDEQEEITHYVAIKEDISARKAVQDALKERNTELERLNREKNEFLGIVAHDLKNPLAGIRGMAQLLKVGADTVTNMHIREYADAIEAGAQQMFTLITNLLDVNAIETGKLAVNLESVECADLLREVTEQYKLRGAEKNVRIVLEMAKRTPPVLSHADTLRQVLDNLVSNAMKYSPPGFRIDIDLSVTPDKYVQIRVRDQGPGFTEADKANLFGKFARLSAKPTGGEHSTGLGLFIVKKLTDALNGKVWCESEAGQGACFILELPLAPAESLELDPNLRILVAEDNLLNRKIALINLQKLGLQADATSSGTEVLEALGRKIYDIVLMDIQMPGMDGLQATAAIHRQYNARRPRIIALTGSALEREACLNAGMDGYLLKPFTTEHLAQALRDVLN